MTRKTIMVLFLSLAIGVALAHWIARGSGEPTLRAQPAAGGSKAEENDRNAIQKTALDFASAFNKADAKGLAAMWTENGESREASGQTFLGRAAIEKSYTEFFKANAGAKIEVLVKSIRFPAVDLAVEEGLVRMTRRAKDLPTSVSYVVVHVREKGQWKIALSSEGASGQDRLEDLDWLLGDWTTKMKDDNVTFHFARDANKAVITAKFARQAAGKDPISGNLRIAFDPETGRIRSWGFEDDGGHSQSVWQNDGKSWILDSRGVLANGTPVAERIILQRVGADAITWRAIDRVVGDAHLADTTPMRLTRVTDKK